MQASCFPPAPATVKTIFRRHSVFGKEQLERGDAYAILEGFLVWKKRNALLGLPTKLKHLHPEQNGAKHNKQKRLSPILLGSLTAGFTMVSIELVLLSKQIPSIQAWWRALLSEDEKVNFLVSLSAKAFLLVCHSQGVPGPLCICRLCTALSPEQRHPREVLVRTHNEQSDLCSEAEADTALGWLLPFLSPEPPGCTVAVCGSRRLLQEPSHRLHTSLIACMGGNECLILTTTWQKTCKYYSLIGINGYLVCTAEGRCLLRMLHTEEVSSSLVHSHSPSMVVSEEQRCCSAWQNWSEEH